MGHTVGQTAMVPATEIDTYIEGPQTTVAGERQKTSDNADGTATLCLRITAADVPRDLSTSPDGSLWRLGLSDGCGGFVEFNAIRLALRDAPKGMVDIRFQVMASGVPPELLWGKGKQPCEATLRMLAGRHPYPHFIERAERAACLRRSVMFCNEPEFDTWAMEQAALRGFPTIPLLEEDPGIGLDTATALRLRASENLCRLAGMHSRREVLGSNVTAERVETVLRAYREYLWNDGAGRRAEAAKLRGAGWDVGAR